MTRLTSVMNVVDWKSLSPGRVAALYAEEARRWSSLLEWNTAGRWAAIERERSLGSASGLAALGEGGASILGWCLFQTRDRVLEIHALSATSEAVVQALLERMLTPQALAGVDRVRLLVFSDAANLAQTLRARGLSVDRYWYLGRDVQRVSPPGLPDMRVWRAGDLPATAALLSRAYDTPAETRPFAPGGTPDEWSSYLGGLTAGARDGVFHPDASLCLTAGPGQLMAVALVTRISETTAHLAQIAVDPQMRRRRVGAQLVELACAAAARAGCARMTVLVGGGNRGARSFLEALRFTTMESLVAAGAVQPLRFTSVAPVGAVTARR